MAEGQSGGARRRRVRVSSIADSALRVRVAGSSGAVPRAGVACSCYLIETRSTRIILDCGPGAVQSLRRFMDPAALDAVIISHMHADHVFDLVPLRYLCAFPPTERATPLDVYVHCGGIAQLHRLALAAPSKRGARFFERSMRLNEYDPAQPLQIGDLRVTFAKTVHYIEAYAIRVANAASSITYSADTAPSARVVKLARGTDLFICECSLGPDGSEGRRRGHSSATEAARMARDAGAKQLLLTHYGEEFTSAELIRAAKREYRGRVSVADGETKVTVR
jgi:ribonuclease BN (tRNA processing enzyme)